MTEPGGGSESDAMSGSPAQLSAGRIGRPHGLDGSFYVTGPRPRLLAIGTPVSVAGRTAAITRRSGTDRRPILRLEGIEDRAAVEALRGLELAVEAQDAPVFTRKNLHEIREHCIPVLENPVCSRAAMTARSLLR